MAGNNIGALQGNGTLNIGPWQSAATVAPPLIITDPVDQYIEAGEIVTFSVTASGTAPLVYQWYKNGFVQVGEISSSYSYTVALSNDGDVVYCNVSNAAGNVDSNTATLSVFETITISDLEYYTREQPSKSEELVNRVEVTSQPLVAATVIEELFQMSEVITLDPIESIELVLYYRTQPALETGTVVSFTDATGAALSVAAETYYPWGAELTITNLGGVAGSAKVKIEGLPLELLGEESLIVDAEPEIKTYGLQEYVYPVNHLIQSPEMAALIASNLLSSYKTIRKDTTLVWRGNPALELGDTLTVPEYKRGATEVNGTFKIIKNQIEYDGTLIETTNARKV